MVENVSTFYNSNQPRSNQMTEHWTKRDREIGNKIKWNNLRDVKKMKNEHKE